ncbi:MAG: branched-chain amino acid aminotransferase [SAR202 cluster bacterium]|nr:branched-chain amino acid aminotransferase [SAR202 cluster bacterium]
MPDTWTYYNGQWMPRSQVRIELGDRGFYLGDAVFDLFRTFGGKPYRVREHMDRFFRSLKYVRIDPGLSPEEMTALGLECVRRNEPLRAEMGDWSIWYAATRGLGDWRMLDAKPTVIVQCAQTPFGSFARFYETGAHAVIVKTRNNTPETLEPKLKHTSRMHLVMADVEARDVDRDAWPVLLDREGNIAEGSGSNVFIVTDGVLRTPTDAGILQGVTRTAVLEMARQLGIRFVEEDIQPYDLYTADEAFFSTTPAFALPITKADNRMVGEGKPGKVTRQLLAAFSESVGVDVVGQALKYRTSRSSV